MNTSIPPALDAADLLALARLDDDGHRQRWTRHAQPKARAATRCVMIRTGQPAADRAEATGPERSQGARQAAPAGLGIG
jgi:hypothetical protein